MAMTLEKYSEKSLAIFGDTDAHTERLIQMGGKYILNLRGRPGWIFFLSMKKTLETFIAEQDSIVHPVVDTPDERVSTRKDIYSALTEIQTMMASLQMKINAVMDLAEKIDKPAACDPVDEDIVAPVSLLRRK